MRTRLRILCLFAAAALSSTAFGDTQVGSTTTFAYTGSAQTYPVPAGSNLYVEIKEWAAGGGEGVNTPGGGGAYVHTKLTVTPGQVLTVYVGGGGAGYQPGGWPGGGESLGLGGASGGGYSRVTGTGLDVWAGAGGGGGNGGSYSGVGGAGGGPNGLPGGGPSGSAGGGGSNTSGGGAGGSGTISAGNGGYQGGGGNSNDPGGGGYVGGAGGGGYYGGGAGGTGSAGYGSGGGGGSSLVAAGTPAAGFTTVYTAGSGYTAGGTGDSDYPGGSVGYGGNSGVYANGHGGYVVIRTWTINQAPTINPSTFSPPPPTYTRESVVTQVPVSGYPAISTVSITSGSLPSGMALTPYQGAWYFNGSVATAGTYNVGVTATNGISPNGTGTYSLPITTPTITVSNISFATPNGLAEPNETIAISATGNANSGVSWIEMTLWPPAGVNGGNPIVLGNQPNLTGNPNSFVYNVSYSIPNISAARGLWTVQVRVVDTYQNYGSSSGISTDTWAPLNVGPPAQSIPYYTGFEGSPYPLGSIYSSGGWMLWQGTGDVVSSQSSTWPGPTPVDGYNSLELVGGSGQAYVQQYFAPSGLNDYTDFYVMPVATPNVQYSTIINLGDTQIGFQAAAGSSTATIMAYNGNQAGGGSWVSTGVTLPVNSTTGQASNWEHLTVYDNFSAHTWNLFVNDYAVEPGGIANNIPSNPVAYGMITGSDVTLATMTFNGTTSGNSFFDDINVTTASPFTVPTLSPSIGGITDQSFTVSCSASSNVPIIGYLLTVGSNSYVLTGSSPSYTFQQKSPKTTFAATLTAYNSAGYASAVMSGNVTTLADTTPPTITGYSGAADSTNPWTKVDLAWTSADDIAVGSVALYRNGTLVANPASGLVNYQDTGLSQNTSYSYKLVVTDTSGNQTTQTTSVSTAADTTPPTVPAGLTATTQVTGSTSSITLTWNLSTDNVQTVGYKVYKGGNLIATVLQPSSGSTASTTVTGLASNINFSFTVSAYDEVPNSSAQSSALAVISAAQSSPISASTVGLEIVTP